MVVMVNIYHNATLHANRSNRCREMAIFRFFKMAAIQQLGFLKVINFKCQYSSEGKCSSAGKISCQSVKRLHRYSHFSIFHLPSSVFKSLHIAICITMPNCVAARQDSIRPYAIMNFQKLEILTSSTIRRASVRHHAKFRVDQSKYC